MMSSPVMLAIARHMVRQKAAVAWWWWQRGCQAAVALRAFTYSGRGHLHQMAFEAAADGYPLMVARSTPLSPGAGTWPWLTGFRLLPTCPQPTHTRTIPTTGRRRTSAAGQDTQELGQPPPPT